MTLHVDSPRHSFIVSDIHLSDAETGQGVHRLWKLFKRKEHFIDAEFSSFVNSILREIPAGEPGELIFNGDIFDFDSVMVQPKLDGKSEDAIPDLSEYPGFAPSSAGEIQMKTNWLERHRGLNSEEHKSAFKMKTLLRDHPVWLDAVRCFILKGNHVVFVIGNHDLELHWPKVREILLRHLDLPEVFLNHVRFCEWFYVSGGDTLVEHGNQYDSYCMIPNPIHPLIQKGKKTKVRIPFGNLAGKFMLNGMGLFNPHADSSFIKGSLAEYLKFYFNYLVRVQPFLVWTWFWSAMATLFYSVREGALPPLSDPLTVGARVEDIAKRARTTPSIVWNLKEVHAHPAIFNPFKIMRELWLDRAILLGLIFFFSVNVFSYVRIFIDASGWWFVVPLLVLLPGFIFYAGRVVSEVEATQIEALRSAPIAAQIAGVKRVCQGHIHRESHIYFDGIEYLNTGTWSPAYHDVECTRPYGKKCFVWIRPSVLAQSEDRAGGIPHRVAELYEWRSGMRILIVPTVQ